MAKRQDPDLSRIFNKPPPQAIEAEMAVLGAMILDRNVCGDVIQILHGPEDFYKLGNQAIYQVLVDLYNKGKDIDMVALKQRLADLDQLEQVGGIEHLVQLTDSTFPPHASSQAKLVREKAILRQLIGVSSETLLLAYNGSESPCELLDRAESELFRLSQEARRDDYRAGEPIKLEQTLHQVYEELEKRSESGESIPGLPTGFTELDTLVGGFEAGQFYVLAGRPSMGKSAIMTSVAVSLSHDQHIPVAVFNLEMPNRQTGARILSAESGVPLRRIRHCDLSADDFNAFADGIGSLAEAPMYLVEIRTLSLSKLRSVARHLVQNVGVRVIFIDYLQLMQPDDPKANRTQQVGQLSRGLKTLALEVDVPIVCLSQLNRQVEQRPDRHPMMSDLRDSGELEQDADAILLLYREDQYKQNEPDYQPTGVIEVDVAKNRQGETGTVTLQFEPATMRFSPILPRMTA